MTLTKEAANVVLTVALTAVVVGIFYFTYIPYVSKQVVIGSVNSVMDSITADIHTVLPKGQLDFSKVETPDMSQQDKDARDNNATLRNKAVRYLGMLLGASVVLVLVLWAFGRFNLWRLLGENAVGTVVVAITYFVFVSLLIRNYRSVDPNTVKSSILDAMIEAAKIPTSVSDPSASIRRRGL